MLTATTAKNSIVNCGYFFFGWGVVVVVVVVVVGVVVVVFVVVGPSRAFFVFVLLEGVWVKHNRQQQPHQHC